jgi:hypothetical protein
VRSRYRHEDGLIGTGSTGAIRRKFCHARQPVLSWRPVPDSWLVATVTGAPVKKMPELVCIVGKIACVVNTKNE